MTSMPREKPSRQTHEVYTIDLRSVSRPLMQGHLRMGSNRAPDGRTLTVNNQYLELDGKPWLPVMGEMHYSRYPRQYWEESLRKLHAGGVDCVATYIFWIHHEEVEGCWDWTSDRDLRHFVELAGRCGLHVMVRIGPWSHGECRNGGFPDWLLRRQEAGEMQLRRNDPAYFTQVRRMYSQIAQQIHGLYFKDGGPIIGAQIENEFEHCGGLGGEEHMLTLKSIAMEVGIDVPIYTATCWGSPIPQDEILPVYGCYPDAPWSDGCEQLAPSDNFLFKAGVAIDQRVGSDLAIGTMEPRRFDPARYPLIVSELGVANQVNARRRPVFDNKDALSMAMIPLAGGANVLGYYMFHGGTNPQGHRTTLQEQPDYPELSYDFQAPVSEYGRCRESYHALRPLHLFLHEFGPDLARMLPVMPDWTPDGTTDAATLRWMVRAKADRGFVFISHYQRYVDMEPVTTAQLELNLPSNVMRLPESPVTIPPGTTAVWPFNLDCDGLNLRYATAQPICRLPMDCGEHFFFISTRGVPTEFVFDNVSRFDHVISENGTILHDAEFVIIRDLQPGPECQIDITTVSGQKVRLTVLTEQQGRQCWNATVWGTNRIFVSDADLRFHDNVVEMTRLDNPRMRCWVYPAPDQMSELIVNNPEDWISKGVFHECVFRANHRSPQVHAIAIPNAADPDEVQRWRLDWSADPLRDLSDVFLEVHYVGNKARLLIDGRTVADDYFAGMEWRVGMKRFASFLNTSEMILEIDKWQCDEPIFIERHLRPDCKSETPAQLKSIKARPEYGILWDGCTTTHMNSGE